MRRNNVRLPRAASSAAVWFILLLFRTDNSVTSFSHSFRVGRTTTGSSSSRDAVAPLTNSVTSSDVHNFGPPPLLTFGKDGRGSTMFMAESEMLMPTAPPLTFRKFVTMQEKRVVVTITYTEGSGLRPFFLTAAQRIKTIHPDVLIEKKTLPERQGGDTFEIRVDDKVLTNDGGGGGGGISNSNHGSGNDRAVCFVSMEELSLAVHKARRKRRPQTIYDTDDNNNDGNKMRAVRLEMLKKKNNRNGADGSNSSSSSSSKSSGGHKHGSED